MIFGLIPIVRTREKKVYSAGNKIAFRAVWKRMETMCEHN